MNIRAAVFDVYGTLLEVGPAPPDAEARWRMLWEQLLQTKPPLGLLEFSGACSRLVAQSHQTARSRGIAYPEINWPSVVTEASPQLARLPNEKLADFILGHVRTSHTTRLAEGASEVLCRLRDNGCLLGIASNGQAYTLCELHAGLAEHQLNLNLFEPDLCFWSFEYGFSKPDPHVFQILSTRLEAREIPRDQVLAIGDRLDNDIEPARAQGWQTWLLSLPGQAGNGDWHELLRALANLEPP